MAGETIIPKQGVGRTFLVALWVLGVVGVVQVVAVVTAIVKRIDLDSLASGGMTTGAGAPMGELAEMEAGAAVETGAGAVMEETVRTGGGVVEGMEAISSPVVAPDLPIETQPWPSAPRNMEIKDGKVLALMRAGEQLREAGDMQGALARLREAEALLPTHPKIKYEIADIFNLMGLREKALTEYERIVDLGTELAGDYWTIADLNIRGVGSDESPSNSAMLMVSNILVQRHPEVTEGEKVTLRIALKGKAGEEIVPKEVVVNVFFYDLVNETDVARTTADQPRYQWSTLPIDWKGQREEILDVEYYHPELTAEEVRDLGEREYFGHIVEVYYRDMLQDVVAQPRTLRSLTPNTSSNSVLQNPLFPPK